MRFLRGCKPGEIPDGTSKKVAIIGAGPAGLGAAGDLICRGHEVYVYDQMPEPGGLIIFGIPDFRIPKRRVRDGINELEEVGVEFILDIKVGKDIDLEEIVSTYDAVLIATGTWKSKTLDIPGKNLKLIYPAFDFIIEYHLYKYGYRKDRPRVGKKSLIVGGGLTAIDMCYIALEAGSEKVVISYRRTRDYSPAGRNEFNQLEDRGIEILELTQPVEFIGEAGRVKGIKLIRNKLALTDSSGRPKPIPIEGSEFIIEADSVFLAIGEIPTPPFENGRYGIKLNKDGTIYTDGFFRTTRKGVFAAGDVRTGPSLIGPALASGKKVAPHIHEYLKTGSWPEELLSIYQKLIK